MEDIRFAAQYCQRQNTVFLADGNVLSMEQDELVRLFHAIKKELPHVRRISLYANCRDILNKSHGDLKQLKELGLGRIYMGLESGHEQILIHIRKGASPEEMIRAGKMVSDAGIFLSVTVLLGVGGAEHSKDHALATATVLNEMKPSQIAVLTLMILTGTPLSRLHDKGQFTLPDQNALFVELRTILGNLASFRALFHANHASNYFSLEGRLPRDREYFIDCINQAVNGSVQLKPERLRAL